MFLHKFSRDLAVDLGTSNTLVFVRGEGIVLNEPSIVSIHEADHSVLAVGNEAKAMIGRTPPEIRVIERDRSHYRPVDPAAEERGHRGLRDDRADAQLLHRPDAALAANRPQASGRDRRPGGNHSG